MVSTPVVLKSLAAAASAHLAISLACVANGALTKGTNHKHDKLANDEDISGWKVASPVVVDMYSGKGITQPGRLSQDCVFADPVAICVGREEVVETFRALKCLSPDSIASPKLVHVEPLADNVTRFTTKLHQRYMKTLTVHSLLIVDMKEEEGKDPTIVRFEERWNNRPLLNQIPFTFVRRINGVLSFRVTALLVGN